MTSTTDNKYLTLNEINEMNKETINVSIISIIFIIIFSIFFHIYTIKHKYWGVSIIFVTVVPIIAIIYNIYYNTLIYQTSTNKTRELKEIDIEMRTESKFYEIIAFILFGLGLIYAEFKKFKYLSIVLPYLLFALLFGTIFTSYLKQFVFDYNNIERLLVVDILTFCSASLAVGLLMSGLIIPIVYYSKKDI